MHDGVRVNLRQHNESLIAGHVRMLLAVGNTDVPSEVA